MLNENKRSRVKSLLDQKPILFTLVVSIHLFTILLILTVYFPIPKKIFVSRLIYSEKSVHILWMLKSTYITYISRDKIKQQLHTFIVIHLFPSFQLFFDIWSAWAVNCPHQEQDNEYDNEDQCSGANCNSETAAAGTAHYAITAHKM